MVKQLLVVIGVVTLAATLLLMLATTTIVIVGTIVNYFVPSISLDIACVVAGLAILIGISVVFTVISMVSALDAQDVESEDDEMDEDEFAEMIAEIVSEKLGPHFEKRHRAARLRQR